MASSKFAFDSRGIGGLLKQGRLSVPPNQRPYAWEERHVRNFLEDINEALGSGQDDYFLGTVVLVGTDGAEPSIADGQQRIATTTLLMCRIRDRLARIGREGSARSIDTDFIRHIDRETEEVVPRLTLNLEDKEFFVRALLPAPFDQGAEDASQVVATRSSNQRLKIASDLIDEFLDGVLSGLPAPNHADTLLKWVKYLENGVNIVIVSVPDEIGAYRMFETLNDRGLKASQADILKNYFFSRAGKRLPEALAYWNAMSAAVEALGEDENERLVTYIRHLWITENGPTRERELAAEIKRTVSSEARTMSFLNQASSSVADYVALWSSKHAKWSDYPASVKQNIETLSLHLQVEQIRPLLFSVSRHFSPEEAEKAFRLFVSWSVRFLIYGGRGGLLDTQYSLRAQDVGTGKITKARELREAMQRYVPSDTEFGQAFASARVSRAHLARYYLRALEKTVKADPQPEYVPNEEVTQVNLEHILPLTPGDKWGVDAETARATQKLLGNMVLLKADENRDIGNDEFAQKRTAFAKSAYELTREVSNYESWTVEEIKARQSKLAELAVQTWPLTFE